MKYTVKFGKETVTFEIADKNLMDVILPNQVDYDLMGKDEVIRALQNPIGTDRLRNIVKPGEKIVIVTSDITRPMPSSIVLPPVIDEMKSVGIKEEDISIVLARGSHRAHTEEEKQYIVGKAIYESKITILDSHMEQCVRLGICDHGTPVDIFKPVAQADRIICLGNIEYHYFAGYSGGAKALMPGVSSYEAIQANHSNMVKTEARAGNLSTNPVRNDIDQVGDFIKIDFIVNVILNSKKEIIKAVAGHYCKAHRIGCAFLDQLYGVELQEQADIVIVTPGGFPKDLNLYQSQKSLDNAKHAVKDGGIIILVASAREGFGEATFEDWMLHKKPQEMIQEIRRNFKLGGHKAAAIAMVLEKARIFLVSDLESELVKNINLEPFDTVQEAIDTALQVLGEDSQILLIPAGGSILPIIK
jgi:nickel-dependent lactate racemase